jgi:hypothetical protein
LEESTHERTANVTACFNEHVFDENADHRIVLDQKDTRPGKLSSCHVLLVAGLSGLKQAVEGRMRRPALPAFRAQRRRC